MIFASLFLRHGQKTDGWNSKWIFTTSFYVASKRQKIFRDGQKFAEP
jgi:hypothetical protein